MKYDYYYEAVQNEGDGYVAECKYTFDGKTYDDFAEVDTVTAAHAKLREFRADFRKYLREETRSREDYEAMAAEGTTQGV